MLDITAHMLSIFLVPLSIDHYGDYLVIRFCVYHADPVILSIYSRIFLTAEHNSAPIFGYQQDGPSHSTYFDFTGSEIIEESHE
jgi:hypothetical protein